MQLPHRRGLLIHGPPGTGKTLFGRVLAHMVSECAFLWVTAADVEDARGVRSVFELVRPCKRAILFFEDLDLYAKGRGELGNAQGRPG